MGLLDRFRLARIPLQDFYEEGHENGEDYAEWYPELTAE